MCRVSFFCILFLIVNLKLLAQDKIYLKNGDVLDVETVGRSDSDIEYEIPGSGGQTKYIRLGRIEKIIYKSGVEEVINFDVTETIGRNSLWIVPLTSAYYNINLDRVSSLDIFEILGFSASIEVPTAKNQAIEITPIGSFGRSNFLGGTHSLTGYRQWHTEVSYKFYIHLHTSMTENMYVAPTVGKTWIDFTNFRDTRLYGLKTGFNFIFNSELYFRVEGKCLHMKTGGEGQFSNLRFSLSVGPVIKF